MPRSKRSYRHTATFYRKKAKLLAETLTEGCTQNDVSSDTLPHKENPCSHLTGKLQSPATTTESVENIACGLPFNDEDDYFHAMNIELDDPLDDTSNKHSDEGFLMEIEPVLNRNPFKNDLRDWALRNSIRHTALTELLGILSAEGLQNLPKDSRTLLQTPKQVEIKPMGDGHFWYHGIESYLKNLQVEDTCDSLKLNFHFDGLQISNSSKKQFWPILMNISNIPDISPVIVAVFSGDSKPNSTEMFLDQFVQELKQIIQNGVNNIQDKKLTIKMNAIICDTPARSFVKCIVGHNGYYSCNKCEVKGEYDRNGRHISFPQTDCAKRTDQKFRNKANPQHHQKNKTTGEIVISPLESLPIDMVKDFPIADNLHLIDLGVVKRCLTGWVNGSYNFRTKFFLPEIKEISLWLKDSNTYLPCEFHRSVRGLDCLAFWKATEFNTFLLYLGPVILKSHLSAEIYKHFLLLSCAVRILSSDFYVSQQCYLSVAEEMLNDYVDIFITLHGVDSISSNIHNLCHVVDDVKRFGSLFKMSTYIFENELGKIKNLLRTGNKPLAQIAKRLGEKTYNQTTSKNKLICTLTNEIKNTSCKPPGINAYFSTVNIMGIHFKSNKKNQWFLTKNNNVVKMLCAFNNSQNKITLYGCSLKKLSNFFVYPLESKSLNIYTASESFNEPKCYLKDEIKCKLVSIKVNNQLVFFPLLHTLDLFNMN